MHTKFVISTNPNHQHLHRLLLLFLPLSSLGRPSKPSSPRLHIGVSCPSHHVSSFIVSPAARRYIVTLPIPTVVDANDVTNLSSHLHPLIHSTSRSSLRRTSPTDTSHRCVLTGTSLRRIPALHHYVVIVHRYTLLLRRLPCVTLHRLRY